MSSKRRHWCSVFFKLANLEISSKSMERDCWRKEVLDISCSTKTDLAVDAILSAEAALTEMDISKKICMV